MTILNPHLMMGELVRRLEAPFEDYYVTSHGRVISTKKNRIRVLKPILAQHGYHVVNLSDDCKVTSMHYIHRLSVKAFYGIDTSKDIQTRHLDGNRSNNMLSNIMPGTAAENAMDRHLHGTQRQGESVHSAKLSDKTVKAMRMLWSCRGIGNIPLNLKTSDLSRIFGVSRSCVHNIINEKTWRHLL